MTSRTHDPAALIPLKHSTYRVLLALAEGELGRHGRGHRNRGRNQGDGSRRRFGPGGCPAVEQRVGAGRRSPRSQEFAPLARRAAAAALRPAARLGSQRLMGELRESVLPATTDQYVHQL